MRTTRRGFTLIELMIVVAIIGVLSVLAITGVRKYLANSKTAEARNGLGRMAESQAAQFERESMNGATLPPAAVAGLSRSLCLAPTVSVPSDPSFIRGRKYQSSQAAGVDWGADSATPGVGFACLRFTVDAPQYYMYNFAVTNPTAAGGTWAGTANGDLNGDGNLSTFTLRAVIEPTLTLSIAPNFVELNPDE